MKLTQKLAIGSAMAALALAGISGAQAQTMPDSTMGTTMTPGGTMMNDTMTTPSMMPMLVSGTVQRYYVDRAGYVSAMDVQTADGVKMVRFMPSMGQRVTSIYPVGSNASVYVTSRPMGKMTSYDLAGVGPDMPTPTSMMMPSDVDPIDILKAQPYVMLGAKRKTYVGAMTGYVADPMSGEILAIVLDKNTLVRVPRENRMVQASVNTTTGITPLLKNASVVATGYDEAPVYGVVSPFAKRVAATGITVNGRTLGPLGFGKLMDARKPLLGFDLNIPFIGGSKPDNVMATNMGYTSYDMSANSTMPMAGANTGMMTPGTTMTPDTTMTPGTMMTPGMTTPGMTAPGAM